MTQDKASESNILVLRPGSQTWMLCLLAGVLALVTGVVCIATGRLVAGWLGTIVGMLVAPFSVWVMISPRMSLVLTCKGIHYGTLRKTYAFEWNQIGEFAHLHFAYRDRVCFNVKRPTGREDAVEALNRRLIGRSRMLPDLYGRTPSELIDILEQWQARCSRSQ